MKIYNTRIFKWSELLIVFIGLPLIYYFDLIPFHKSIPLLVVFILFLFILLKDKSFENRKIYHFFRFPNWKHVAIRFFLFALISSIVVYYTSREFLFYLPKNEFGLWLLIIVTYPFWSAYPQELIYRGYFYHRYKDIIKKEWLMILLNAFLFSFSHIIFENLLALILTFLGGIMFSITYKRSNSLMVVFTEHSLYGIWIFSVGIGQYFYAQTSPT
ncbi:MAG: type II CAAX prenyl endopeptidase Rce1 family protein [Bacteroidota bacterium]